MIPNMVFRAPFTYDVDEVSELSGLHCLPEEDLTIQSFKNDCDINTLVKRFGISGEIPAPVDPGAFGDFTEAVDFQTAMEQLARGQAAFDSLPAAVRLEFDNDPAQLWDALHSEVPEVQDQLVKLGVLRAPAPAEAAPAAVEPADAGSGGSASL